MKRIDLKKILRMDFMIQHRCTGSPEEFARTLELSRATFFEYLAYMRHELGVDIQYNRYKSTYHYPNGGLYTALGIQKESIIYNTIVIRKQCPKMDTTVRNRTPLKSSHD